MRLSIYKMGVSISQRPLLPELFISLATNSCNLFFGSNREMIDSFNCQCILNPKIKQPLGHIALSFKPEDAPRLTDEFMAKISLEYMELMSIKNTQFILVRHHNTDNPHCHLVYNRINNEGKIISSQTILSEMRLPRRG